MEYCAYYRDVPNGPAVKNPPAVEMEEMRVRSLGQDDPLEEEMATHSSILAWEIPWTEKPGGLQFMGSQRIGHNWATEHTHTHTHTHTPLPTIHCELLGHKNPIKQDSTSFFKKLTAVENTDI